VPISVICFCNLQHLLSLGIYYFGNPFCMASHVLLFVPSLFVVYCFPRVSFSNLCWCFTQVACLEICRRGTAQATLVAFHAGYGKWTPRVKLLCLNRSIKVIQKELYKSLKGTLHCIPTLLLFLST